MSDTKLFLISHKKLISNLYKDRNMLVTSKKNFDEFCNFIFPVLNYVYQKALTIDDKKELDINRYIGFLAERLVDVFVKKNNLKAKQSFVCFDFKYKKSSKLNKKPAKSA